MEDLLKVDQVLDCKALPCPMPLIKISKAIKGIQVGQILEILATDPGAKPDVEAWTKWARHELLSSEQQGGYIGFSSAARYNRLLKNSVSRSRN
jgi:tRNA 2-thiouridine synthesizing protein A